MSDWQEVPEATHRRWYCPGCGVELKFGYAIKLPELLKCKNCRAEWCMIIGPVVTLRLAGLLEKG